MEEFLLPRREEIVYLVNDHPLISAEEICRRFPLVPKRSIAYDINYLVKKKIIRKHGHTRGVRYSAYPIDHKDRKP